MTATPPDTPLNPDRLCAVTLDGDTLGAANRDIDHERQVAIFDLLQENHFRVTEHDGGPYRLNLSMHDKRLVFGITDEAGEPVRTIMLSMTPFRKIVKDYFTLLDCYHEAIRTAPPSRIEAIDMGRRGLHNEGCELLKDRLSGKVELDQPTARRLFTLMCALHWKG